MVLFHLPKANQKFNLLLKQQEINRTTTRTRTTTFHFISYLWKLQQRAVVGFDADAMPRRKVCYVKFIIIIIKSVAAVALSGYAKLTWPTTTTKHMLFLRWYPLLQERTGREGRGRDDNKEEIKIKLKIYNNYSNSSRHLQQTFYLTVMAENTNETV